MYIDAILLTVAKACEANTGLIFPELKIGKTDGTYIQNPETKEEFWINGVAAYGVFAYKGPSKVSAWILPLRRCSLWRLIQ